MTIAGLADNVCLNCDEHNATYANCTNDLGDAAGVCQWAYDGDPDAFPNVVVTISFNGTDYILTVAFQLAGVIPCTGDQLFTFQKNLGTTKPACLTGLNGDVPFVSTTTSAGTAGCVTDPDCGCLIGGVTCDVQF